MVAYALGQARPGETEWNATRRLQGQRDIELSDHGRRHRQPPTPGAIQRPPRQVGIRRSGLIPG
ncbi:MAG: histidine phosphatase family protein [Alphaproteobacteria bacterium]